MTDTERIAVVTSATAGALAAQTPAPEIVPAGAGALQRAHASGAGRIWILAGACRPRPDALQRLATAQRETGAAIVAGVLADRAGRVLEASVPGFLIDREDVFDLAGRGLLPIRHAPLVHCLLDAAAFARHGFPDDRRFGRYAGAEWTARVLRDADGYLAATSVAVTDTAPLRPDRDAPALIRMLRSGTWSRGERLAELRRRLSR